MDGRPSRGLLQNRKKIFKAIERRICRLSGGLPNTKKNLEIRNKRSSVDRSSLDVCYRKTIFRGLLTKKESPRKKFTQKTLERSLTDRRPSRNIFWTTNSDFFKKKNGTWNGKKP